MEQHSEVYSDVSSRYASALISLASQEKMYQRGGARFFIHIQSGWRKQTYY